jgi:BASS family bile acid:Na+ symporter
MKIYWAFTLLLMMAAVGMSLDPREVISRWARLPRGFWLGGAVATFVLPPLFAMLMVAILPLPPAIRGPVLVMSIAPGAPMLTRMVAKKGGLFDPQLAAGYQILVGLLTPVMTPALLFGIGRYYHRDVWVDPWTLAWQVASMQFVPLVVGLLVKHRWPGFAAKAEPWLNRIGNVLVIAYLLVIVIAMRRVLGAVGPGAAGTAVLFGLACLAFGHWLAGPTIALSNTNRHVGLAILIAGLNFKGEVKTVVPFFAAYAIVAPLLMTGYAFWQGRRGMGGSVPA